MALTPDQISAWSGKPDFRAGFKLVQQYVAEIVADHGVRVHFPALNLECRFIAGTGLSGAIVSGGKGDHRQVVVAAVAAFQKSRGTAWAPAPGESALEASEGTPRTRSEVLEACQTLLNETLANGLSRLSSANQQRWATLAVSALGVNLPRLALALRSVSDEAALALNKDARSDLSRMLTRMSHACALCTAIQNGGEAPKPELIGWHRTRYDEVGHLDLVGISAWPWRTASGFEGLTVLFWNSASKRWNSWSESRPLHQTAGFKATARYLQAGPWEGAVSPQNLARNTFRLMNAKRNPGYRLSASAKSRVIVTGPAHDLPPDLPIFADWIKLAEHLRDHSSLGLKESDPLDSVVAIKPTDWGERAFDPVLQTMLWPVMDSQARKLTLTLRFDDLNEPAIKYLETVPQETLVNAVLIGRATRAQGQLHFQPFTLHRPDREPTHLALDTLTIKNTNQPTPPPIDDEEQTEPAPDDSPVPPTNTPITHLLTEIEDTLLALAEAGTASINALYYDRLEKAVAQANRQNLEVLTTALRNLSTTPTSAPALLGSHYITQSHLRAESTP